MAKMVEEVFPTLHGLVPTIEVQTNWWKFCPTPILVEIVSTPIGGIWFQGQLVEITPRPIGGNWCPGPDFGPGPGPDFGMSSLTGPNSTHWLI